MERLADQPQRSSCLCLSRAGIAGLHQCVWFLMWVLGFELRFCASVRSSLLPEPSSALLVLLSNLLLFLYNPISSFHPRYFALSGVLYKRHHSCLSFSLILLSLFSPESRPLLLLLLCPPALLSLLCLAIGCSAF